MVPMWNGSLVREIESQRLPEILEAETSTRSQGTSRKDLVLSEIDEFQGCVGPTRTSGWFPHRPRPSRRASNTSRTASRSSRARSAPPPSSGSRTRARSSAESSWVANQGQVLRQVLRLRVFDGRGAALDAADVVGALAGPAPPRDGSRPGLAGRREWMGVLASRGVVVLLDRKYGELFACAARCGDANRTAAWRRVAGDFHAPHGVAWWTEPSAVIVANTATARARVVALKSGRTIRPKTDAPRPFFVFRRRRDATRV